MADLFWLSDEQWAVIDPFMPKDLHLGEGHSTRSH